MGLIICEKHGQQGIVHLCCHLHNSFMNSGTFESEFNIIKDESGMTLYLCVDCIEKYELTDVKMIGFDDLLEIGDDLSVACGKCITNIYPIT